MDIFTKQDINICYDKEDNEDYTKYVFNKGNAIIFVEDLLFYKDLFSLNNKGDEFNKIVYDVDNKNRISNENLYNLYCNYCYNINDYHTKGKKKLLNNIKHLIKNKGSNNNLQGKQTRWIEF
jgi:hypothetical protein